MPSESDSTSQTDFEAKARTIAEGLRPGRWLSPLGVLREFRAWQDLTLLALSAKTGNKVSTGRLSEYENGKMVPKIDRFIDLVEALGGVVVVRRGTKEWRLKNDETD